MFRPQFRQINGHHAIPARSGAVPRTPHAVRVPGPFGDLGCSHNRKSTTRPASQAGAEGDTVMKKTLTALIATTAIMGTLAGSVGDASAQRGAVAAGVAAGLVGGAIIGGAIASQAAPAYVAPAPVVVAPAPVVVAPRTCLVDQQHWSPR